MTTFTDTSMLTHATVSARLASARLTFFLDSGGVGGFQSKFISKYLINNMVFFTYNFFSCAMRPCSLCNFLTKLARIS